MRSNDIRAFPRRRVAYTDGNGYPALERGHEGMTLRDYFAAKAMHGELVSAGSFAGPAKALARAAEEAGQTIEERIAFNAYRLADVMLVERAKGAAL